MGARADKLLNAAVAQVRDSGLAHETIRMGTVTAVSSFGTVSVQRNDDVFPVVRLLGSYAPAVGDRVEIANTMGGWICLGPLVDWDTSWQYPTLNSPLTNHGGGYSPARYRKTYSGIEIQGVIDTKGATGDTRPFLLPEWCRPTYTHVLLTYAPGAVNAVQMRVYSNGTVIVYPNNTASDAWVALDCSISN